MGLADFIYFFGLQAAAVAAKSLPVLRSVPLADHGRI